MLGCGMSLGHSELLVEVRHGAQGGCYGSDVNVPQSLLCSEAEILEGDWIVGDCTHQRINPPLGLGWKWLPVA